ncbi:MAG: NUDIX hydrolase [Parcubacteria group bacterium Gr01-1014_38]|nr:MAG: NUDIX hydrolase [Parcubacteria group bacterium Gr01-1014_38]
MGAFVVQGDANSLMKYHISLILLRMVLGERKGENKKILLSNKWITVWKESFYLPNGTFIPEYYFVQKPDFVIIVPLLKTKEVLMLHQWRPIPQSPIYNLPMGFVEPTDSSPLAAAQREFEEEIGYTAETWIELGSYWRAPSFLTTKAHIYLTYCTKGVRSQARDIQEAANVKKMDIPTAKNRTSDLTSLTALLLAEQWLQKKARTTTVRAQKISWQRRNVRGQNRS